MKVYYHIHLGVMYDHSIITAVYEAICIDSKLDIKASLKEVWKELNEQLKIDVDVSAVEVFSDNKKSIPLDTKIDTLSDILDLTITVHDDANKSKIKYERTLISKESTTINSEAQKQLVVQHKDQEALDILSNAKTFASKKRNDLALAEYLDLLRRKPDNFDALFGVTYIYFNANRYQESLCYFEKIIGKASVSDYEILLDYGCALMRSDTNENSGKAVSVISRCINDLKRTNQPVSSIHDANVKLAEALEIMGQHQHAFQLYLTVAQMTDKQHVDGLLGYARVGYKLKQVSLDDVFIVVLNAIAQKKNDKSIQRFFTEMVQENGGFEALRKQMHAAWTDATAVVYIAIFLRENGALKECMKLLDHAFRLAPNSIDVALLMVHVNENLCTFAQELKFAADFCEGKLDRQVIRKIDLSLVVKILRAILSENEEEINQIEEEMSTKNEHKKAVVGNMAQLELQLLALYFTIVKSCFVLGHLRVVSLLVKLLDPLLSVQNEFHKTLIKNEFAYYSCISQMQLACPPVPTDFKNAQKVYVIGDSHVLSLAWRSVKGKENDVTLHPILVTGLKVWHLRADSRFYTKSNFFTALKSVPSGATCVFVLGEIDCRGGITEAVEKCLYSNEDEAISKLLEIYMKSLTEISKRKKIKVIVHPVPPVLKETYRITTKFNNMLRDAVLALPKFMWLDFVDQMVDTSASCLKETYSFDGAHLHPKYVELLENEL